MNKTNHPQNRPRAGATWWGQRWIEALEHSSRDVVARLGRGRAYARDGHVRDLQIHAGKVLATVSDDELDSYRVSLQLEVFTPKVWQQALQAMSEQALFAAQLLNGEMPREIDRLFRSCGKSLFPNSPHDIDADCACEDWSSPCKHVAATHYVLGEALDRDPFLLFELRGRSKEQVLAALSELRSGQALPVLSAGRDALAGVDIGMALCDVSAAAFEQPSGELSLGSFNFDAQYPAGTLLRTLGTPASWRAPESPQALLGPILARVRQLALRLASDVNGDISSSLSVDKSARPPRRHSKTGAGRARQPESQGSGK